MKWSFSFLAYRGWGWAWALLALAGCGKPDVAPPDQAATDACRSIDFEGSRFTHCIALPARHTIRTALAGGDGKPYRDLGTMAEAMGDAAANVAFAMNGGMYDEEGEPIGYYVEDDAQVRKLNRNRGEGNFHLLPNGVFSVEKDGWHVRSTDSFAAEMTDIPSYATQSGPMLVIDGELHPAFAQDGTSLHHRNGVGVDAQGRAHFAISEEPVSFGRFARLFRDRFGCDNALFLDGSVSALWNPVKGRLDRTVPLGPLIVAEKAPKATR